MNETFDYDLSTTKGRQIEIDIVKGLAILFMFAVHTYEEFYILDIQDQGILVHFVRFFGGPLAAPVFMLCMGISMNYTQKKTSGDFIRRGLKLFFLGYLLQFARDMIPFIIKFLVYHKHSYLSDGIYYTFGNDIMIFAGLAYIFMGLFKKSGLSDTWLIAFYLFTAVLNVILLPIQFSHNEFFAACSGLLWGSWENSWFPFLTWIFYPIAGYLYGKRLMKCTNKDVFYKKILTISLPLLVPLILMMYQFQFDFGGLNWLFHTSYYHHDWFGNIFIFDLFLAWISGWHFVYKYLPNFVISILKRWSGHINTMYCIQWIFIGFLSIVVPYYIQPLWCTAIIFVCAISFSDFVSYKIKGY